MNFKFQGVKQGKTIEDSIKARTKEEAFRNLQRRGYENVVLSEIVDAPKTSGKKISTRELAVFFRQLAAFEKAGEPISKALHTLSGQVKNQRLKGAVEDIKRQIDRGSTLAKAFDSQKIFPAICINLIRVGETSGGLEITLRELANYLKQVDDIERGAREAMFYPKIVLSVLSIALLYILYAILPDFKVFYDDMGIELPGATKMMFAFSIFLNTYWMLAIPTMIGIWYFFRNTKRFIPEIHDRAILHIPIAKGIIKNMLMFRFVKTLYILIARGVEPLLALKLSADTMDHTLYSKVILDAREMVRNGESISVALRKADKEQIFDFIAINFIQTGEETGHLDELLERASEFYQQTLTDEISSFSKAIEPLLLIPVGIFIAILVMSTYLPVFRMIQMVKH